MADTEPQVHEVHPELHHYTNMRGLEGIVTTQTLWAVRYDAMNDPLEFMYAKQFLSAELSTRIKDILLTKKRSSLKFERHLKAQGRLDQVVKLEVENWVDGHYRGLFHTADSPDVRFCIPHIISFCSHQGDKQYEREHGLLSQWRGYGNEGAFALVFDTKALVDLAAKEFYAHAYVHMHVADVNYDREPDQIRERFKKIVDSMADAYAALEFAEQRKVDHFQLFQKVCGLLKHRGFHEEREVRLVAYPVYNEFRRHLEKKNREDTRKGFPLKNIIEGIPKPHISLFDVMKVELPIKRIIVGPSSTQVVDAKRAEELTKGKVRVQLSETPYRIL